MRISVIHRNLTIACSIAINLFIKFEAEPSCPAEVESRIRITDGVLRYLIVKDELGDAAVDIAPKAEEAAAAPAAPAEAPAAQAPEAAPSEE